MIAFAKSKIFLVIFYGDCQSSQDSDIDYGSRRNTFLNLKEMLFGIETGWPYNLKGYTVRHIALRSGQR